MKKHHFLILLYLLFYTSIFAQNTNGFKYQAIVRDAAGNVNAHASVAMEISILQSSADGTVVFTENHNVTSNTFGLVNLTIGSQNPTVFDLINWANGPYFIKILVDGVEFGTSQLLSVPYALHAKTAESVNETDPLFSASTAASITQSQIDDWTSKLSEYAESDPDFNASVAAGITADQIESWTNKLNEFIEIDPDFAASLAKGISATDTAYWNNKLDEFVETDPTFLAHPASGITDDDITMWKALWIWYTTNSKGYLTAEVDGSVTNEIQVISISNDTIYLENGGYAKLPTSSVNLDDAYRVEDTITADLGPVFINGTDGIISTGIQGQGATLPIFGEGTRLIWYPKKSAFRVGYTKYDFWDDNKIGIASFASGWLTQASGSTSTAFGQQTIASGISSTATGYLSNASGTMSTAMGYSAESSGTRSVSIGEDTEASGRASLAMGHKTTASGDNATALGSFVEAQGNGSFYIGDSSVSSMDPLYIEPNDNRFTARFNNGYYLFTRSDLGTGVFINNGGFAWVFMSDKNKKENFKAVNGEEVLSKISQMNLTSWNMKGQDPSNDRHYGPMAQDFYAAFGHDGIGTVGNETSICTSDFDGINLIGIKALELRTSKNAYLIEQLKEKEYEIDEVKSKILEMEKRLVKLENLIQSSGK